MQFSYHSYIPSEIPTWKFWSYSDAGTGEAGGDVDFVESTYSSYHSWYNFRTLHVHFLFKLYIYNKVAIEYIPESLNCPL